MSIEKLFRIRTNNMAPAKGKILISEPLMNDYYFGRSVVLLAEHNEEGSFGLVMNKPLHSTFNEVVQGFPPFDAPVFMGGPVQTDSLFFVHTLGDDIPESNEVIRGLYWGGDLETVREMITLNTINASQIRFYIGYSGWDANQLEDELKRNAWLVSTAATQNLLNTQPARMWERSVRRMGTEYDMWRRFPADPQMN